MSAAQIPQQLLAEIRRRVPIEQIVGRSVALKRRGREYAGLCPFHAEKTPSFTVVPGHGFFKCFGCGSAGDVIGFYRRAAGVDFKTAVEDLAAEAGLVPARDGGRRPLLRARPVPTPADDAADRERAIATARELWRACVPATGTLVETYLATRGIDLAAIGGVPPTLRFHPTLPDRDSRAVWPAMVGAVQGADDKIVGVHRTYLARDGRGKAPIPVAKKMLGPCWGGAVRFARAGETLALAEGIETALSVLQAVTGLRDAGSGRPANPVAGVPDGSPFPVWAALSLGNLAGSGHGPSLPHPRLSGRWVPSTAPQWSRPGLVVPEGVKRLVLLADADNGDPESAEALLQRAARRFKRQGLEVRIARPPTGMDFNDLLREGMAGAAAPEQETGRAA